MYKNLILNLNCLTKKNRLPNKNLNHQNNY